MSNDVTKMMPQTGRMLNEANVVVNVADKLSSLSASAAIPLTAKAVVTFGATGVPATPPEIAAGETEQFTASLHTDPGYFALARVTTSAASDATTFDTGVAEVYSGQTLRVANTTAASVFLHLLLIDADGAAATAVGAKNVMRRGKE